MSAGADARPAGLALARRQVGALLGLELRKTFLRLRALPVVLVAFLPAVILMLRAAAYRITGERALPAPEVALNYANIFQFFFLRSVLFFVCFADFYVRMCSMGVIRDPVWTFNRLLHTASSVGL